MAHFCDGRHIAQAIIEMNGGPAPIGHYLGATRAFNQSFLTFNSLNSFILKGEGAQGMELTFASLMARASDEPDAQDRASTSALGQSGH
jgi:hypothetical protein